MIDVRTARRCVLETARPLTTETIELHRALGRTLAQDIRADRDQPPADRSAMDGFALRAADASEPGATLPVSGEVAAGQPPHRLRPGTCVRIYTGAVVPPGADAVVRVEDTETRDEHVTIHVPVRTGSHIRRRAEEAPRGTVLLTRGTVLGPAQIGLCASVGKAQVKVHRRPSVAVIATGSEVIAPDQSPKPWQIRDSNGPTLVAALQAAGVPRPSLSHVTDQAAQLRRRLRAAVRRADLILLSGGVSMGRYDLVPRIVEEIGARVRFHKVAMKPGKPVLYATFGRNRHLFGLPGNPLSVLTAFHEFVLPCLQRLAGRPNVDGEPPLVLPLAEEIRPRGSRTEFVPVRLVTVEGRTCLQAVPFHGSGDLAAGARAHGVAVLPRDPQQCRAGEWVAFRPWGPLP